MKMLPPISSVVTPQSTYLATDKRRILTLLILLKICFSIQVQCYLSHNDYSRLHHHGQLQSTSTSSVSVFMPWATIPPKITMLSHTMTGDTIDIPTDSTIKLRCTGQRPLIWTFPNNNSPFDTFEQYANLTLNSTCDEPSDHLPLVKCISDLTIVDAKFDMTGYFTCQYNQSGPGSADGSGSGGGAHSGGKADGNQMSSDMADSIYIFVNDISNLIVPFESATDYLFIAVFQSQSATIPCRATYSGASVTLWKVHTKENVPQQIKPNSTLGISHNPKKGFYFDHPRWDSETNVLECRYEIDGLKAISTISIHWSILPTELHPIIDDTNARHIFLNESFTLRCFVHIEIGVIIVLDWDFPNKNDTSKRIIKSHIDTQRVNVNGNSYDTVALNVTVWNASLADQGEYRCNVTDGNGRTFSAIKKIVIHDEHQPSTVNFTTDFDTSQPLIRDVGDDVRFMVVAHAFPDISLIDLSWYKDGQRLELNTSHYQIEIFSDVLTQISFYIQNARASDSGTYTLMGNSSSMSTNISIVVYISGQPEIVMENVLDFYVLNQSYELVCKSYSHPVAVAWWSWMPCNSPESCFSPSPSANWTNLTISDHNLTNTTTTKLDNKALVLLDNLKSEYLNVSRLKLEANQSGIYRCSAKNVYNVVKHQPIPFIVMDVAELFSVFCSTDEPTLNDTILFTCKASIFEYKQIGWSVKYYDTSSVVTNTSDLIQTNHNNQYSLTATIVLRSIKLEDSALFTCHATRRNADKVDHKEIYLNVKNVTVPSIVDSNMANGILEKSANSQIELKCYVSGRPWPTIVWYRNSRQFNTQHDSGIRIEERGQRLIFTRLLEKDSGLYECRATNRGGHVFRKAFLRVKGGFGAGSDDSGVQPGDILVTLFLALVGTIMMIMAVFIGKKIREERIHKRELEFFSKSIFENGQMELFNPEMSLDEQIDLLPYDSRFEFPKERLKLGRTLGQGAFGRVVKAEAIGLECDESTTTVAVKMLKERADANQRKALMAELKILIHLGRHLNIVNLLGAMTKNLAKGELFVIVEYCEFGNLRHFLLSNRDHFVDQLDPTTGHIDPAKLHELVHNYGQAYQNSSVFGSYNLKDYANYNSNGTITSSSNGPSGLRYIDLLHQNDSNGSSPNNNNNNNNDYINTNGATVGSCESPTIAYYNHNYVGSTWRRRGSQNCRNSGRSNRPVVTTSDLICYSFQCARGMEYLTSRKLIHRDLAARNVLLASNNVVKICDFGLAKDVYKYDNYVKKDDGPLPIKWMAIESISDKIFTSKSDVWSFGILLWEIFTLGKNPYPGIEIDEEFYKRLKNGYRMEKPEFASVEIHQLMLKCWNASPVERPDFTEVANIIGDLMEAEIREHYITLNNPYDEMNEQIFSGSATALPPNSDYLKMTSMTSGYSEDYLRMSEENEMMMMTETEGQGGVEANNNNNNNHNSLNHHNQNNPNYNQMSQLNGNEVDIENPCQLQRQHSLANNNNINNNNNCKPNYPIEMIDMQTFNDSTIHYDNFEIVSFTPNNELPEPNNNHLNSNINNNHRLVRS